MLGIENLYEHVNTPLVHHLQNALRAKELYKRDVALRRRRTARSRSSTSSPAACSKAGATPRVCTKRSRRRKASGSRKRTRRSPRSRSRTTSRCTTSSSGMTGTAKTQLTEFEETYKIGVVEIPTNRDDPRRRAGPDLQDRGREVERGRRGHRRAERARPAGPGRHGVDREVRAAVRRAEPPRRPAQRPEREATTRRKRRSSPRPVARAPSPSRRTWPAEASTSCSAATPSTWHARRWRRAASTTTATCCSRWTTRSAPPTRPSTSRCSASSRAQTDAEHERGGRPRRALRPGHRTPRIAPDRQPAPRPVGPPGRPGRVAVLPLARGRPDADVRERPGRLDHGAPEVARRRADQGEDGQPRRRERAEADRGAQLRAPEERPEVRRGDERPARGRSTASAGRSSKART